MKRLFFMIVFLFALGGIVRAQSLSATCNVYLNSPMVFSCPFAGGFSLVGGSYVRLSPSSNAIVNGTTSDAASQVIGIPLKTVQNRVFIQVSGLVTVNFDGATTAGHTVTMSTTTAGYLHDTGGVTCAATSLGTVSQSIGGAGQASMYWGPCGTISIGGGASWGSIIGTLSSQTDLNTALGLKAATTAIPLVCAAASASGSAYTCATTPTFVPAAGSMIVFKADVANTGTASLVVNGQAGTPNIHKTGGSVNIVANDLLLGQYTLLIFDGTNWDMQGQLGQ